MEKNINHSYFYQMYLRKFNEKLLEESKTKIGSSDIYEYLNGLPKEEKLLIFDEILFDICDNYISLSNSDIYIYPNDSFCLLNQILDNMHDNIYKESFLFSLQIILGECFCHLDLAKSGLTSSSKISSNDSGLKIVYDKFNKIIEIENNDNDLIKGLKMLLNILSMERENKIGPFPEVKLIYRKDV